jgi:hypothetical protein
LGVNGGLPRELFAFVAAFEEEGEFSERRNSDG